MLVDTNVVHQSDYNLYLYVTCVFCVYIQVKVGNLRTEVGSVEYAVDTKQRNEVWIIGVAVGGGFLLTLIIVILVVYVRKSTQADRQYKKLKMQLDTLESNVRNECKQGKNCDL